MGFSGMGKPAASIQSCSALRVLQRVAELAANRHRLPEQPGEAARLGMLRHVAPAVERDLHQLVAALDVIVIPEGEDAELRADRRARRDRPRYPPCP